MESIRSVNRQVDRRGKCEQKRKNKNKREQNQQKTILTCVRKHAPIASQGSALPSECGGSERLRKKAIKFYNSINGSNEYTKNRIGNVSCPRLSGSKRTTFRGAKRRSKSE